MDPLLVTSFLYLYPTPDPIPSISSSSPTSSSPVVITPSLSPPSHFSHSHQQHHQEQEQSPWCLSFDSQSSSDFPCSEFFDFDHFSTETQAGTNTNDASTPMPSTTDAYTQEIDTRSNFQTQPNSIFHLISSQTPSSRSTFTLSDDSGVDGTQRLPPMIVPQWRDDRRVVKSFTSPKAYAGAGRGPYNVVSLPPPRGSDLGDASPTPTSRIPRPEPERPYDERYTPQASMYPRYAPRGYWQPREESSIVPTLKSTITPTTAFSAWQQVPPPSYRYDNYDRADGYAYPDHDEGGHGEVYASPPFSPLDHEYDHKDGIKRALSDDEDWRPRQTRPRFNSARDAPTLAMSASPKLSEITTAEKEPFRAVAGMAVAGWTFTNKAGTQGDYDIRLCFACGTDRPGANTWRRSLDEKHILCNKCGIYHRTHKVHRRPKDTDVAPTYTVAELRKRLPGRAGETPTGSGSVKPTSFHTQSPHSPMSISPISASSTSSRSSKSTRRKRHTAF